MPSRKESPSGESNYSLDFLPEVDGDTEDAFDWYESQRAGLGDEFLLAIEECLNKIQQNPFAFQKIFKEIRRALSRKFPFGVFFIVKDDMITITAIVHLARHPKSWKKRR